MTTPEHEAVIERAAELYLRACHERGIAGKPWRALDPEEVWCWMAEAWRELEEAK